ncbi:hypothetical protein [Pseudarthrobacter sp. 1C304]|uniref:hypothetical protein n=1 Tax=Pseudarthrobacter sp. 1C304 TaxID=3457438 RepID=UPI003FD2342C
MNDARRGRTIALAGLLAILALTASGCQVAPSPSATASGETSTTEKAESGVVGTGEKIDTAAGPYEKSSLPANDPAYSYNPTFHDASSGWTVDEASAAQKLAIDYMSKEFLDSTALEGGDAEFQNWYAANAKKYFSEKVIDIAGQNPGENKIILGNFGTNRLIPNLIHDGSPRVKEAHLGVTGFGFVNTPELGNSVEFSIEWNAGYRVDDTNGAAFVGHHTGMTGEQVLNSKYATDKLKDGSGENVYRGTGSANVMVTKDPDGLKIVSFSSKADFDTRDFANQDAV